MLKLLRIVIATGIPNFPKLYNMSLQTVQNTFNEDESKILKRIYPNLFNPVLPPEYSGLFCLTSNDSLFNPQRDDKGNLLVEEVDLSELNIERIPVNLSSKLNKVKVLNLSKNPLIRLNEPWFEYFYDNLNDCYLDDYEVFNNFKKLERLSISGTNNLNKLSSLLLSKLKHLDISNCHLDTKDFLTILRNSPNLESLNFANNSLKDIVEVRDECFYIDNEDSIGRKRKRSMNIDRFNMKKFKSLNFKNCSLDCEDFVKMLFNLPCLESLVLSGNSINYEYSEISNNNNSLKRLELVNCDINKPESLNEFTNFKHLEFLDLSSNNFIFIKDSFKIGSSKDSLIELNISNCKLQTRGLKEITKCSKLQKLNVSGNLFGFMTKDFDFGNLKNTLVDLNISGCRLSVYNGLKAVTNFTKLKKLNFSSNFLGDITENFDFNTIKETLVDLSVISCCLDKRKIGYFTDFPNLEILIASSNNILSDNSVLTMGSSKDSLNTLILESCNLNEEDLNEIVSCSKLRELDISENDFEMLDEDFNTLRILLCA